MAGISDGGRDNHQPSYPAVSSNLRRFDRAKAFVKLTPVFTGSSAFADDDDL
jgi:hypothetical protein